MANIDLSSLKIARATIVGLFLLLGLNLWAGKDTEKGTQVDHGTFGIYVGGKRVATETFSIKQYSDSNVTTSEIKLTDNKTQQTGELRMNANGDLVKYEWRGLQPQKATSTVEPNQGFLIERTTAPDGKTSEQPFLMPTSTGILDDFFFSQRQVLLWRYLASNCRTQAGAPGCELQPAKFGVVIPRQHTSTMVTIGYDGREKVLIKGAEVELNKFSMKTDGPQWSIWTDDDHKVLRITVPESNTEVVRD